jgi:hypothetical protein
MRLVLDTDVIVAALRSPRGSQGPDGRTNSAAREHSRSRRRRLNSSEASPHNNPIRALACLS